MGEGNLHDFGTLGKKVGSSGELLVIENFDQICWVKERESK